MTVKPVIAICAQISFTGFGVHILVSLCGRNSDSLTGQAGNPLDQRGMVCSGIEIFITLNGGVAGNTRKSQWISMVHICKEIVHYDY